MSDETTQPLVSIITATWNASETVGACLASAQAQDYTRIQHILVDGGSTDATTQIVQDHAGPHLQWLSERDRGIYDAWNKGLKLSRGEWIAFLGADDLYLPGAISAYMQAAALHPRAEYFSSKVRWVRPNGSFQLIGEPWRWSRFRRFMCTAHVGSMHRRSLFTKYGTYDEDLKIVADYEFLLRAGSNLNAAFLPVVTAQMLSGGASDSLAAVKEAASVKLTTGRRSRLFVRVEQFRAALGFRLLRLLHRQT